MERTIHTANLSEPATSRELLADSCINAKTRATKKGAREPRPAMPPMSLLLGVSGRALRAMPRERPALSDVRFFSEKWGYVGNPLPVVLDRDILPGIQTAVCQVRVNGAAIERYWNAPGLTQRGSETSVSERGQNGSLYSTTLGVRAERPWAKLPKSLWHLRIHSSAKPRVRQIRPKSIRESSLDPQSGKWWILPPYARATQHRIGKQGIVPCPKRASVFHQSVSERSVMVDLFVSPSPDLSGRSILAPIEFCVPNHQLSRLARFDPSVLTFSFALWSRSLSSTAARRVSARFHR
jgi:hypothetical protein